MWLVRNVYARVNYIYLYFLLLYKDNKILLINLIKIFELPKNNCSWFYRTLYPYILYMIYICVNKLIHRPINMCGVSSDQIRFAVVIQYKSLHNIPHYMDQITHVFLLTRDLIYQVYLNIVRKGGGERETLLWYFWNFIT